MQKPSSFSAAPGIMLTQASLCFQQQWIFKDLTLVLPAGQITCLLGPSGVGKTTLLRLLAGLPLFGREHTQLKRQDAYSVCEARITTTDQQPLIHRIAYMAQTDLLMPWLSVLDNVLIGDRLRGNKAYANQQKKRALTMLEQVNLSAVIHKKPGVLSGGMKQRVALVRTLMEDKPVVLMDEPFSALDAVTRFEMQTLAAKCLQGKTVLVITHDPWEALRLGHQIIVLHGQPVTLSQPLSPPMPPPRDLTAAELFDLQRVLLRELHMSGVT